MSTFIDRTRYKIERLYFRGGRRLILDNLTLEQAQAHCSDPETSSSTCTTSAGRARTRRLGPWFDSYTEDR
jgi:hypothetical protein